MAGRADTFIRTVVAMYRSEPTPRSAVAGNNLQRPVSRFVLAGDDLADPLGGHLADALGLL